MLEWASFDFLDDASEINGVEWKCVTLSIGQVLLENRNGLRIGTTLPVVEDGEPTTLKNDQQRKDSHVHTHTLPEHSHCTTRIPGIGWIYNKLFYFRAPMDIFSVCTLYIFFIELFLFLKKQTWKKILSIYLFLYLLHYCCSLW